MNYFLIYTPLQYYQKNSQLKQRKKKGEFKHEVRQFQKPYDGEFKHEVRQFQKPYDNQQAEQISLMV